MDKQVLHLSVLGVISSLLFGSGLIILIPTLIQCVNVKKNYRNHNEVIIENAIFYCITGIILNIISMVFYFNFVIK